MIFIIVLYYIKPGSRYNMLCRVKYIQFLGNMLPSYYYMEMTWCSVSQLKVGIQ